jgi:hypothetical protein
MMPDEVEDYLQEQIDEILKTNSHLKDQNHKLQSIQRDFGSSKPPAPGSKKPSTGKYSNVRGKLGDMSGKKSD